ncbi:alpha/beta-hydrolase [Geopyxis carbonaria]|nr:alpha/beta-hydrolase [Geopyxis carbonaria]
MNLLHLLHLVLAAAGTQVPLGLATAPPDTPHTRNFFYVSGSYTPAPLNSSKQIYTHQLYVERLSPSLPHSHPHTHPSSSSSSSKAPPAILLLHGAAQTATNFLNTPDLRPGWASFFLSRGHTVYLPDQLSQGRSPAPPNATLVNLSAEQIERYFTDTAAYPELWPQAKLHTQWPAGGRRGDAGFDAFYASNVPIPIDGVAQQEAMTTALLKLAERIGEREVVVVAHSQAGAWGWTLADALGADRVKGVVMLEPPGPPFEDKVLTWGAKTRAWGLADVALTFDPAPETGDNPLGDPVRLGKETDARSSCLLQREPARRLTRLAEIPSLVVTAEASYHAVYDHCTVEFLQQAGVKAEHVRLEERGIRGNGHMFFMERNNIDSWRVVQRWIEGL